MPVKWPRRCLGRREARRYTKHMAAPRILIVDDQAAVREELAFALGYEGFDAWIAKESQRIADFDSFSSWNRRTGGS